MFNKIFIIDYVKTERAKEEYKIIENLYMNNLDETTNIKMNKIQITFFEKLKHIFNTYNSFYGNIEQESRVKISYLNKEIEEILIMVLFG